MLLDVLLFSTNNEDSMSLKDQFMSDLATVLNTGDFAREVVYITQGRIVNAIVNYLREQDQTARGIAARAELYIAKSDTAINQMDEFMFDAVSWVVERVESVDDQMAVVTVRCKERLKF